MKPYNHLLYKTGDSIYISCQIELNMAEYDINLFITAMQQEVFTVGYTRNYHPGY